MKITKQVLNRLKCECVVVQFLSGRGRLLSGSKGPITMFGSKVLTSNTSGSKRFVMTMIRSRFCLTGASFSRCQLNSL